MDLVVLSVPLGIILGYLRKGSLKNLENAYIKYLWIAFLAFFLRFFSNSPDLISSAGLEFLNNYLNIMNMVAFILLFLFAGANFKYFSMKIFTLGQALNALPIFLNAGRMPFEISAAQKAGTLEMLKNFYSQGAAIIPSDKSAILWQLGDYIILPGFVHAKLISIGDIVLFFAMALFVSDLMISNDSVLSRQAD